MENYTEQIKINAQKINILKARIDETVKFRDENEYKLKEWQKACSDFHKQYNELAFPGGFSGAYEKIKNGDPEAIEAALCFIECRPYFFRSGYMYKDIMRKLKKASMDTLQTYRFKKVYNAYIEYRDSRNQKI